MAGEDRTATRPVSLFGEIEKNPQKYGFYAAIRRLECAFLDKPRVGRSWKLSEEPFRLAQEPSLAFAPSTLASFTPGKGGSPPRLAQFFFGLFGPNGPLPLHLTEFARQRVRNDDDTTLVAFADLFHHRMLAYFYNAWAGAQPTASFDRPGTDRFQTYVGALCGIGMPAFRDRDGMSDLAKLFYCGRLSGQTRSAEGLAALLSGFFRVAAEVREFVGTWRDLPDDCLFRLGESAETGALGATATLGSRVFDCQQKIRIVIGPLGIRDYERLLPGGESLERLAAVVRNYLGDEYSWDLKMVLRKEELPPLGLDGSCRLGRTSWLTDRERRTDADDFLYEPDAYLYEADETELTEETLHV